MKKLILSMVAIATIALTSFGQAPEGFKYQAVVRDAGNTILNNQAVGMRMTIQQGSISGTTVYQESFAPTTNAYGLVNLEIGSGTVLSGDFTTIDWANGPYFIETAVDVTGGTSYVVMGTSQLMSVPYALHANTAESVINDQVDDADADPNNEIQDISLTGTDLSISGGSTLDLSSLQDGTGTDDQTLTLAGTDLSIEAGNTIDLSTIQDGTGTDDQNLTGASLTGTSLQIDIENGTSATVDLAGLQDGTGTDDQTLSFTGNTLGIESGNSVDLSGYLDNTDAQTLSLTGTDLSISGGNTLTLPNDNDWTVNGANIHNANTGNVGIGIASPNYALHTHTDVNSIHQFTTTSTGTTVNDGLLIGNNSLNDAYIIQRENANLFVRTNNTDRITINGSGNVGIGTSTPSQLLEVSGNDPNLLINSTSGHGYLRVNSAPSAEAGIQLQANGSNIWTMYRPSNTNDLRFYDGGDRVTFKSGGNVGIGTTSPNYALHTHTDVNSIMQFTTTSTGTTVNDGLLIGNNSLNDAYIIQRENANLFVRTNNTDRLVINGAGNVGIGTSTPNTSAALEVNSTTGSLLLPRLTTAQRDALTPETGMMIYNTDDNKFQGYTIEDVLGAPSVDQEHTIINNAGGGDRAQSFTAGATGVLTSIELPFNTMSGTTDVNITIRDGDGTTGTILHTQTFTIPGGGMIWYSFNITGVTVTAGASYTIHVTEVSPGACGFPPCYDWGMDTSGDNYPGGLFYFSGAPYSGGTTDCAFRTNVATITPTNVWVDFH